MKIMTHSTVRNPDGKYTTTQGEEEVSPEDLALIQSAEAYAALHPGEIVVATEISDKKHPGEPIRQVATLDELSRPLNVPCVQLMGREYGPSAQTDRAVDELAKTLDAWEQQQIARQTERPIKIDGATVLPEGMYTAQQLVDLGLAKVGAIPGAPGAPEPTPKAPGKNLLAGLVAIAKALGSVIGFGRRS